MSRIGKSIETKARFFAKGRGNGQEEYVTANRYRVFLGGDGNVLELVVIVTLITNCQKNPMNCVL